MADVIDTRQLRAFVTLARSGSFTVAAKELFLSQSAVSHSIRALEEEVGCRLFDRVGKKAVLTLAGEQLLQHAQRALGEMSAARQGLERLARWGQSRLRVGASASLCEHFLPGVLQEFHKAYPGWLVTVCTGNTGEVQEWLGRGTIDIGFALETRLGADIEYLQLFCDELHVVAAAGHPWSRAGRVDRQQLPKEPFIIYSRGSQTFRLVEDYFREDDITLNVCMELGSIEAIKQLVQRSLGVSALAGWTCREELAAGRLVALPPGRRRLQRNWGVLRRAAARPTLAEETLVKFARIAAGKIHPASEAPTSDPRTAPQSKAG